MAGREDERILWKSNESYLLQITSTLGRMLQEEAGKFINFV